VNARRYGPSILTGAAAFLLAIVTFFVMIILTYGPIDYSSAERAGETTRRLLAWLGFALVVGAASAVLVWVPFAAARRWGTNALLALVVALVLAGLAADTSFRYISYINDCALRHKFPYTMVNCG